MSVPDFRIQTDVRGRISTKKLVRKLGFAGFAHWVFAQAEIRNRAADGDTSHWTADDWALAGEWTGDPLAFVLALVEAGLLARSADAYGDGEGWVPIDWRAEQGWAIREPARIEAAAKAGKISGEIRRKNTGQKTIPFEYPEDRTVRSTSANGNLNPFEPLTSPVLTSPLRSSPDLSRKVLPSAADLADLWNMKVAGKLPEISRITDGRRTKISARLGAGEGSRDLEWWHAYFDAILATPFLLGANNSGWRCDFDFAVRSEENVAKILEGSYARGSGRTSPGGGEAFLSASAIADRAKGDGS